MRLLLTLVLFGLLGKNIYGQNLIPNPGFEDPFTALEFQWVQPQGPFYHYEDRSGVEVRTPHSGKFVNGICMYNMEPNEYLHVKLLEPLTAGGVYRFEVYAILMQQKSANFPSQRYIGIHFGKRKMDTHVPGDLDLSSDLNLRLPDSSRFEWFALVDTFFAKGGEEYLTIGCFPETLYDEQREKSQEEFFSEIETKYSASSKEIRSSEDKNWLYLPPDEQQKYLKQKKKEDKRLSKIEKARKDSIRREEMRLSKRDFSKKEVIMGPFAVRYYFDDFCLTKLDENGQYDCGLENPPEPLEAGRTIQLRNVFFQTNEARLQEESEVQLNALAAILLEYPKMRIEIRGHTDDIGNDADNLDLSRRRAGEVVKWLQNHGIQQERLSWKGYGEANPIETNDTEAGRMRNRRVEFFILEM